ncbi:putative disease resistance protein RGA3 [Dioscorea cayenensis subsp. rotundata]|uniref:Disease resistance protein RGA3 n=1 Tax=Dioscorea cayennensis subsp. rotundata TaxID=55577 RepID=A0AB40D649_DIOCR|nr:putative disease resistance protein RGA3 [Dioscorea cayenensis subsp. rotundata]
MVSATLSTLAGYLLSPLPGICLDKLINYVLDHLSSSPSPSSLDEAEKQQQLKDSLEALIDAKLSVKSMHNRIMILFEKNKQNERVIGLHHKLKDVGYDIQDLESDMKNLELERMVQEINKADQEADTNSQSSRGQKRLWFRRPISSSSDKKRRLSKSAQSSNVSTDDDVLKKITSIINQIKGIKSKLEEETILHQWLAEINLNGVYDPYERVTTSSINESKIYGRDNEKKLLIEFFKGPNVNVNVNSNISVAPIVGMGGIGKTTLAQFVYKEIKNYFNNSAWICVSNHFDRLRITKEMVDSFRIGNTSNSSVQCSNATSLNLLEEELIKHLVGRKFLLVLDDIWSDKWQQLLVPLQSAEAQAIKIIVTCRHPTVLRSIDQENKIILEGFDDQEYWPFFQKCAFAGNNPDNYPRELHDIGRHIVGKLMGSPLAAKTVGKLLGRDLTEKHWNNVLENDLWKFKSDAHDIMPALALSYYHLPPHLQSCFAFCSVLPNRNLDPYYDMDTLISMWRANGYLSERISSETVNDMGKEYFHELQAMCFFDGHAGYTKFLKMHDLIRDLSQLVSHGETCIYESGRDKKISKNVRHLCVYDGSTDLGFLSEANNLRTLLLLQGANGMSTFLNREAFSRVRVLIINDSNMQEFPDAIPYLKHLQHLTLWRNKIKSIPDSLCGLYQLRVLKLMCPQTLPSQFHNLINLEILHLKQLDTFDPEELEYHVNRERGFTVAQLRNMNELRGGLSILCMENIANKEEAMKAKLKKKLHIKKLRLCSIDMVDGCEHDAQEVLEGLEPHSNLEELEIEGYMGSITPRWLMNLQKLSRIYLNNCRKLARLPAAVGLLRSLEVLRLHGIENLAIECESCDDPDYEMFPSLLWLELYKTTVSFEGMSTSSSSSLTTPVQCKLFPRLQNLSVTECDGVNEFPWHLCSTPKQLEIINSPGFHGLFSLTQLQLSGPNIKTFPAEVMSTLHALEEILLEDCNELLSVEGLQALPSLRKLSIYNCHEFRYLCMEEMTKLHELDIKSCHDLESLPAWLHRLPSLKHLNIRYCPKFHSLPKDGLPSSLEALEFIDCDPGLMKRCQEELSPEWQMIKHIPKQNYISDDF